MLAVWMIPVMNVALVCGVALVMPLSFKRRVRAWLVAALGVALALAQPPGSLAAVAVAPWVALTLLELVDAVRRRALLDVVSSGFAATAALALVASRLELTLFGIGEPIVKLTALHFTYAGVGTLTLARQVGVRGVPWVVSLAPPIVAVGFITRLAVFQVGGAVAMTAGAWLVAGLQARRALGFQGVPRALLLLSAACPWVAMVLGVLWAANQYWPDVWALTVPDMVPTHGALNAFGFVLVGLLGWRRAQSAEK